MKRTIGFTSRRSEQSSIERHLYRVHADGSGMMRISNQPGTQRISMSPDARYFLDRFSDIRTLPVLRLHTNSGGECLAGRLVAFLTKEAIHEFTRTKHETPTTEIDF